MVSAKSGNRNPRRNVRFVLDGEIVTIEDADPTRTVLQFLREDIKRTGTKEGCAEGDCGACTVVVAEVDETGERLQARAINSCIQFLPTLDGKELLTIESLADAGNRLHPAQKAMIDAHGSQCGFCTPGFVMSLFALYKNNAAPGRREVDEALAGNLCRCTGYNPIAAAALNMYGEESSRDDWRYRADGDQTSDDENSRVARLKKIRRSGSLHITGDNRQFLVPSDISALADLLLQNPSATILAGGTDVGLWVTKQHHVLDTVIYVGEIAELTRATVTGAHLDIGAAVTLTDAMPLILEHYPSLAELFIRFASPPIRNAGTLGGNIANGSPIGDSMPALLALQTQLVLRKGRQTRTLPLADFYLAYQETALRKGEFVERILVPLPTDGLHLESYKISKRFDQDISAVCAAFSLRLENNRVTTFFAAFGGMAAIPARAMNCERALVGQEWNSESIAAAMHALDDDFTPLTDMRASAAYRRQVGKNLLQRFFLDSNSSSRPVGVYHYGR
ncbi:MAG: xanthine dehydrogenase small subunit [Woeseiaceae bacterium]